MTIRCALPWVAMIACAPPPVVESIAPVQGPRDREVAVEIRGRGFATGAAVTLAGPAYSFALRVDAIAGAPDAAQTISGTVPAGIEAGGYDVQVANPDGSSARLGGGYRAIAAALRIAVLDVGEGASLLAIGTDGSSLLVDGGKENRGVNVVLPALRELADGQLDAMVATHFDSDHIGGLVEVLRGPDNAAGTADDVVPAHGVWDNGGAAVCTTEMCARYRELTAGRNQQIAIDQPIALGDASARCVAVRGAISGGGQVTTDEDNENSVALLFEFGGARLLVAGDLTGGGQGTVDVETPLAQAIGQVDLWHLDHHGSATSTAASALALLSPRAALISVGTDNAFCHPAPEVLQRLTAAGVPAYLTGAGTVTTSTNCPQATQLGASMRVVGRIDIEIDAGGGITVAGDPL